MSHARPLRFLAVSIFLVAAMVGTVLAGSPATPAPATKLVYHDSEGESAQMLEQLGFKRSPMAVVTRFFFHPLAFVIIVALVTLAALAGDLLLARKNKRLNLGGRILSVSVLLTVFQWHASLEQDAMQRYEAEIANANAAETSDSVARMLPHLYPATCHEDYEEIRYVYIHLDNLEYAAERYRHGFASASTTERAVMTFVVHCKEPRFESRVRSQVEGYSPDVHAVVERVLKNLKTR